MYRKPDVIMKDLITRYPVLKSCEEDVHRAYSLLISCYNEDKKVLIVGNGGSGADAGHIVGELMKGFMLKRKLSDDMRKRLMEINPEMGPTIATKLQGAFPSIDLTAHSSLNTAFANDVDPNLIFAQQVLGYGKPGDIFWGISTSGNSKNILYGICVAKAIEMTTFAMTGKTGGKMRDLADISICVPAVSTPEVQELHLPVYHALCAMVEAHFFQE